MEQTSGEWGEIDRKSKERWIICFGGMINEKLLRLGI
jgi:hypothetical protein